jgi:hypothetical protein
VEGEYTELVEGKGLFQRYSDEHTVLLLRTRPVPGTVRYYEN